MNKIDMQAQLMDQKMKVDFNTYDLTVKELINMVAEGILDIAPDYQRQFRWDEDRQSSLVETIFLGIPVPSLFMATNSDGTWELIDGVQRISTIIHFAASEEEWNKIYNGSEPYEPLELTGLKKLTSFNGMRFSGLPYDIKLKFKLASIKATTLTDKSDKNVRFDLFERLNRGGVTLSDQEIRSCVYRGPFNDFLKEMAKYPAFKECVKLTESQENDATREELVLRFFAFSHNYQNFVHSVVDFLNDYMEKASQRFNFEKEEKIFKTVFDALSEALPNGIVRGRKTTPINLYEGVAVGASLAYREQGSLKTNGISEWINDKELIKSTTGATNSRTQVARRIEFCKERFV